MRVIDSHTEGEPTRVIIDGGPDPGSGSVAERAERLQADFGGLIRAAIIEPRGHNAIVGALPVPPDDPDCVTGVIYFNNSGNLGMCGHATIGLGATLAYLGRISAGTHRIETPVGIVEILLEGENTVTVKNVESYRLYKDLEIDVPGYGRVTGDVAWGGNWFFLTDYAEIPLRPDLIGALTDLASAIRDTLDAHGVTGTGGAFIDHIEIGGPPVAKEANARNFVLCPGLEYDRSPCGTGTSAKVACLAADGLLAPEDLWVQESIIGSTYDVRYQPGPNGGVIPSVRGRAFVTSDATLIFDGNDPYRRGIVL